MMNNRRCLLPLAATCLLASCAEKPKAKKPNIIVIMTDDHTTQAMSCYGSQLISTPNLDRLANEGMRFDNCYVTNAISGPSRACMLTGKLGHKNGFTDNSQTFDGDQQTFPKILQANGYQTAMIGKWHLNSAPQGFDFWSILIGQGQYYKPEFVENGDTITENGYVTDVITEKAIRFLNDRDKTEPFAMLYYHKAPHRNWMPAQRHLGIFNDTTFPLPESLLDDYEGKGRAEKEQLMAISKDMWLDWDLKVASQEQLSGNYDDTHAADVNAAEVQRANQSTESINQYRAAYNRMTEQEKARWEEAYKQRNAEAQLPMEGDEFTIWKYQQYMRDYMATLLSVDENVGRLLSYLESIGELDNTIILYTSDQGFFLGEYGWFDKRMMYEECHRMPLLMRYPKMIKAGSTSTALTMNIDFAPTFLDMAGLDVPEDMQGTSIKPVLENQGATPEDWREAVYYHYYEYPSWHMVKRHYGVRTDKYKLIHFYNDVDEWRLFDMQSPAGETRNLYGNPAYREVQDQMMKVLEETIVTYDDLDPTEQEIEFFKNQPTH